MRKIILAGGFALLAFSASAQNASSPLGKWKTLDDQTGKAMTITEVYATKNGTLSAKIIENLGLPATCADCGGQYKGKPIIGMITLWNLKANKDGTWGGGNGYKPSEDRSFNAKSVQLLDGGNKLEVKGCVAFICRTATWVRVN
jgi:uncharacterized protein (DUF2147 family)